MRRRTQSISLKTNAIAYHNCPAKTYVDKNGDIKFGRNVFNHCQIVGYVARCLLEGLPQGLREHLFPSGSELLAAAHDLGKVSPTFF